MTVIQFIPDTIFKSILKWLMSNGDNQNEDILLWWHFCQSTGRPFAPSPAVVSAWRRSGISRQKITRKVGRLLTYTGQKARYWVCWSKEVCYEYSSGIQHLSACLSPQFTATFSGYMLPNSIENMQILESIFVLIKNY